ncbi:MAG TPA: hypothetical protein VGK73_20830 [Polyangiaceae bacterium]
MRSAAAVASVLLGASWSLVAFAQAAAPKAEPAPTPPAEAPSSPASPSPPASPDVPAPAPDPGAPAQQPAPPDQSVQGPPPAPAPAPPSPGASIPAEAKQLPAEAAQTPEGEAKSKPVPPANERGRVEKPAADPWQDGHALAIELSGRVSGRLNAASVVADYEERAGLGIDGTAWLTLSPQYVVGFGVRRADLGDIAITEGANTIDAGYATTAIQLGMRAFPFRSRDWDVFVGLRAGLAWQDVNATGLQQLGTMPDSAEPFACSGVSSPGFAFGAEVGAAFRASSRLWLTGTVDMNGYRLSSDVVGECVPGIGAITTVSAGLGLLYAFDLGREAKLSASAR